MKPVYQTVNNERRYTVLRPVYETSVVEQPYTVCRPVTTVSQETVECGYYQRQYTMVPGPVVERQVRVPVETIATLRGRGQGGFSLLAQAGEGHSDRRRPVTAAYGLRASLRVEAGRAM